MRPSLSKRALWPYFAQFRLKSKIFLLLKRIESGGVKMKVELMSLSSFILEWVLIYDSKTHYLMFHVTFHTFILILFWLRDHFFFDRLMMLWHSWFWALFGYYWKWNWVGSWNGHLLHIINKKLQNWNKIYYICFEIKI